MAIIYPKIENKIVGKGEFVKVPIYIDTQFEEVNTVEVRVRFSDNLIFRDYLDRESIISLWIEKPHLIKATDLQSDIRHSQTKVNEVIFSGIIAGGFNGKEFNLVELIFEAKESGLSWIEINKNSQVLLNDGLGTKAKVLALDGNFEVSSMKKEKKIEIEDKNPPQNFKIYLAKDKNLFNGKYFITFNAVDKESGIAYYEIYEKPSFVAQIFGAKISLDNTQLKKVESPYVLEDQSLRSFIFVKAVDKAGNERIEVLKPVKIFEITDILILGLFCLLILIFLLKLKNKKHDS